VAISAGPPFLKNHAKAILACDFFVAVTATFRVLYVFVVIEHASAGSRQCDGASERGLDATAAEGSDR
jgi:hypothetical protein